MRFQKNAKLPEQLLVTYCVTARYSSSTSENKKALPKWPQRITGTWLPTQEEIYRTCGRSKAKYINTTTETILNLSTHYTC